MAWPTRALRPVLTATATRVPLLHRTNGLAVCRRGLVSARDLQFGQPVYETHPHLLKSGELTPGITALEYAERRGRLSKALPPNSAAILAASDVKYKSGAVFYEFHQDSDFLYLTGFNEPEAIAVIENLGPNDDYVFHLFVRPKDPKAEQWEGARSGIQAVQDVFNADSVGEISNIEHYLVDILGRASQIFTDVPAKKLPHTPLSEYLSGCKAWKEAGFPKLLDESKKKTKSLRDVMNELRAFKSPAEVQNMRRAGQASGRSITESMRNEFSEEKDLYAFLDYRWKAHGCNGAAYVPVVAGGKNALSIHYTRNDAQLEKGKLVLVDAGGEYGSYITDITRTWPVNGKFSSAQKDLYEVVLSVQRSCISLCREDAKMSLDKLHEIAENKLKDGLKQLGFDISGNALRTLFPHHLGHHIGLDVHDLPGYSRREDLKTGMCITIEPGIYVPDDDRWPVHFRGMGIRIEDSVAVQQESPLIFSTEAVKEVIDIEALRH